MRLKDSTSKEVNQVKAAGGVNSIVLKDFWLWKNKLDFLKKKKY